MVCAVFWANFGKSAGQTSVAFSLAKGSFQYIYFVAKRASYGSHAHLIEVSIARQKP
jgi:hypothetical protein